VPYYLYLQCPVSSPVSESVKVTGLITDQLVKEFHVFYETWIIFARTHSNEPVQSNPHIPFIMNHFSIMFTSMPTSLTLIIPYRFPDYNSVSISHLLHEYYIFLSHHLLWIDHPNNIWWRAQILSSSLCSLFLTSYYFLSLSSKYTLHTILFLNSLNACSSLWMREKASHSYEVTGKIIVLHTLVSRLLAGNGRQAFW
jgi:hypothetical protein